MPWDKVWDSIFALGGVPPALFILVCGALAWCVRELRKSEKARLIEHKDCSAAAAKIDERRIEDQRVTLQILDRNAVNMAARTAALDGTVNAIIELTKGFEKLALTSEANNTVTKDRQVYIDKHLEELLRITRENR